MSRKESILLEDIIVTGVNGRPEEYPYQTFSLRLDPKVGLIGPLSILLTIWSFNMLFLSLIFLKWYKKNFKKREKKKDLSNTILF